jgi:hypothetical protein
MPLVKGVGGPILSEDCHDQNQKRKFVALLLHRIAASLFLPLLVLEEAAGAKRVQGVNYAYFGIRHQYLS